MGLARATSGRGDVPGGFSGSSRRRGRVGAKRLRRRRANANARRRAEGETRGDWRERDDGFRDASTRRERRRPSIERRVGGGDGVEDDARARGKTTTKMVPRGESRRRRGRKTRGWECLKSGKMGSRAGALSLGRSTVGWRAGVGAFDGDVGGGVDARRARRGPSRRDRRRHERLRARRVRRPGVRVGQRGRSDETPRGTEIRRRNEGGPSCPVVVAPRDGSGDD